MHIDFADKSTSKSISPKVSKYQFDTLNCSLEELAVLERVAQNPSIKQQELVSATGKSIATVKRIITSLQDKNYIRRENGKRYGKQSILFRLLLKIGWVEKWRTARDMASGKCGLNRKLGLERKNCKTLRGLDS